MPGEVAAAAPAAGATPPAQRGPLSGVLGGILRMGVMWYFMNMMKGKAPPKAAPGEALSASFIYPVANKGDLVDFYAFVSERTAYHPRDFDMADLVWSETGIRLAEPDLRKYSFIYEPTLAVQNNGSVYLHVVLARAGSPILPSEAFFEPEKVFSYVKQLNVYLMKPKNNTGVNLLTGAPVDPVLKKDNGTREVVNFLRPNITIQVVDHFQSYPVKGIPAPISAALHLNPSGNYIPIVHFNDFWTLRDKLVPVNESLTNVTIHLEFGHASLWYWQILQQMEQSFGMQQTMGLTQEGESDEVKRVLLEGNPYLLALTFGVSLLHTVFDMLAFKNDIGFWKNNKSMEGLSARTILFNAFCQLVILLYLFDQDTSFVVLLSSVLGTAIEIWKVTKAFKVTVNKDKFPYIKLEDRATYANNPTKKHDAQAMTYLYYSLLPLVFGYSIYTLMYKSHKSWYSWVLSTLVGAVYMFGFILMCPQLYLNYKLKSVAHLPWRQMTYKFLNTIIDDLFAFVIKMPLLHRLSVFRDDVVFLVYLYQRWIYRVDRTRANEFGWTADSQADDTTAAAVAAGTAPAQLAGGTAAAAGGDQAAVESSGPAQKRKGKGGKGGAKEAGAAAGEGAKASADAPAVAAAASANRGDVKKEK